VWFIEDGTDQGQYRLGELNWATMTPEELLALQRPEMVLGMRSTTWGQWMVGLGVVTMIVPLMAVAAGAPLWFLILEIPAVAGLWMGAEWSEL
jgi:hypothetical protein